MRKSKLAELIRNPFILAAAIFLLNILIGWILIAILTITNIANSLLSWLGIITAAYIIGGIHAVLVKEPIPAKTKAIAVICYSVAVFVSALIVLAAAGLPLSTSVLVINVVLGVTYAVAVYAFLGIGEKGFLRTAAQKKLK